MKSRFLNYIKSYRVCVLLNSGLLVFFAYSYLFPDAKEYGIFNFNEALIIYGIPLYSVIYAIVSYCVVKKIFAPLAIFAVTVAAFEMIIEIIWYGGVSLVRVLFIVLPSSVLCLIALIISAAIYHAKHVFTVEDSPVKPDSNNSDE